MSPASRACWAASLDLLRRERRLISRPAQPETQHVRLGEPAIVPRSRHPLKHRGEARLDRRRGLARLRVHQPLEPGERCRDELPVGAFGVDEQLVGPRQVAGLDQLFSQRDGDLEP